MSASVPASGRMPAAFLGHGSPMNAIETNRFTSAWRSFGEAVPRPPRAILMVSAHWYVPFTAVTAMPRPRTIHDFFGFPDELFAVDYPAPGSEPVAEEVAELVKPTTVGLDRDSWGLDHGTWSVLVHAFPKADIPVVQLAINARRPFEWHFELGAKLAPLRDRDVLVMASGNVVHNLRAMNWRQPEAAFDWAERFGEAAASVLLERPADVASLAEHPDFRSACPTPDHFIPVIYLAALAAAGGRPLRELVGGYAYGSISMAAYGLDAECPSITNTSPSAAVPDPAVVPPENANI